MRIAGSDGIPNETLDPPRMERALQILAAPMIYESVPDLDESLILLSRPARVFEPLDGGTTWTSELQDGVTSHDGSPPTADDVAFSITRAVDPDAGSRNSVAGQLDLWDAPVDPAGMRWRP